ncbi:FHA domain-containing protein [Gryllotalpicola protaetiae]|uniref:FHA domain-containing protein n=1 Tax=Gryllotalpicola protaetiae TaxID=2419771 RepID=A0A387BPM9_9MICO|nr:FHA domain-containing protein [Gryllotalpicola protaetiae]AYG03069.1 FHA domain-containing protein [Gryllotalpicola protaetiae]
MSDDGYITPPPGLLPPPREPDGAPQREQVPAAPGGMPFFTPSPGPGHTTGPTIPSFRPSGPIPAPAAPPAPPARVPAPPPAPPIEPAAVTEQTPQVTRPDSVPGPTWSLVLTDGSALPLAGATFVGRNPTVTAAAPGATLLPLADPAKSLSKTHALLVPELDYLMVTDLHSTNGLAVIAPGGAVTVLEPGRTSPVGSGSQLQLGSFTVTVTRS